MVKNLIIGLLLVAFVARANPEKVAHLSKMATTGVTYLEKQVGFKFW